MSTHEVEESILIETLLGLKDVTSQVDKSAHFGEELTNELELEQDGDIRVDMKTGGAIRMDKDKEAGEKREDSAQQELDAIPRDPQQFQHPAYQVMAEQSNTQAEATLGLVHTE